MKLFWKIFISMFISFVFIFSSISYIISVKHISDMEKDIIEDHKILGSFLSKEVEVGYFENKWPFESLKKLSKHKGVLFWWIVRDDGTIHLADNESFMETYAQDYFPQIAGMAEKDKISLNHKQNYGIFFTPLETGKKKWSFWFGFSLKEISERRKEIIFLITAVSLSALVVLGAVLYFAINHFTKPIKELTVGAERIGTGDLAHRIKVISKDELGQLSHSFNKMTEDLQKTTVSKDYVDNIIESMVDALIVVDPNGKIITVNKATRELSGYQEEELLGNSIETIFPEAEEIYFKEKILEKLIKEDELRNYETYLQTKDGKKISILFNGSVVKDKDGRMIRIVCTARDITERKQAEEEINQNLSLLNATLEATADGILVVGRGGKIEKFNEKFIQMWRIPESVIASRDDDQALAFVLDQLKDPQTFLTKVRELYDQPAAESFDILEFKDRRTFERYSQPQRIGDQSVGKVWSFRDITDRKRAEAQLIESEERYRTAIEHSNDGIAIVRGGMHLYVNKRFVQIFGYDRPEEIIGKPHSITVHPDDLEKVMELNARRQKGEPVPERYEFKGIRKDRTAIHIEVSATKTTYQGEAVSLAYLRDITERKQTEQTLTRSEETAKRLSQENEIIAEIGRIISSTLNIEEIYERFAEEAKKLIPFDRIVINTIDIEKGTVLNVYMSGQGITDREVGKIYSLEGSGNAEMVCTKSSLLIQTEDFDEYKDRFPMLLSTFQAGFRSIMNVPLFLKGKIIGGLLLRSFKPYAYTDNDVMLAERVGNQIAGAIVNAQLFKDLQKAIAEVKQLGGLLPICSGCKKIRDDKGYWNQIEEYISDHSEAIFSHGLCPECLKRLYPDI